ncbi:MAG: RNA-binding protein [Prevotellaceae bacterium]|nr:RNA-binding protein [Prevotella sp.]MDD7257155.1 RNA-binding protein [Prevotellaceae bacterium]MDY6130409.1 RNA-binding protein [Prevotella sp.]
MNIYVSNINFRTQEESIYQLFSSFGEVTSVKIITDRESGRSRGFGFVEMSSDAEGQAVIDHLNGTEFEGKILNVNLARPREERSDRGGHSGQRRFDNRGGFRGGFDRRERY